MRLLPRRKQEGDNEEEISRSGGATSYRAARARVRRSEEDGDTLINILHPGLKEISYLSLLSHSRSRSKTTFAVFPQELRTDHNLFLSSTV